MDFQAQLDEWNAGIADCRIHGTTHEQPLMRFAQERDHLVPLCARRGFRLEARVSRIVAGDYLLSFETNRYSVPFQLIGQTVQVQRQGDALHIFHRDRQVAAHPTLPGKHGLRIAPEHGPAAAARNQRSRRSTPTGVTPASLQPEVEIRDLALYDRLLNAPSLEVNP